MVQTSVSSVELSTSPFSGEIRLTATLGGEKVVVGGVGGYSGKGIAAVRHSLDM